MILIGVGANLPGSEGSPRATCEAALACLGAFGAPVVARSPWYETAPIPDSDQPWFVNAVARVSTCLSPEGLLLALHRVEALFGRARSVPNAARTVDLDLLAYHDLIRSEASPLLPHPRLHERAFVLFPLQDLVPGWRHPVSGRSVADMARDLPPDQEIRRIFEPYP